MEVLSALSQDHWVLVLGRRLVAIWGLFGLLGARTDFPVLLIRSPARLTHGFLFLLELDLAVEDDVWSLEMFVVRLVDVPIGGKVRPLEVLFTGVDDVQSLFVVSLPLDQLAVLFCRVFVLKCGEGLMFQVAAGRDPWVFVCSYRRRLVAC